MTNLKRKIFNFRTTEEELKGWKEAAIDQRYTNFSQFIRDAINEKIEFWNELQDENED